MAGRAAPVAIVGPTASGKSTLALAAAEAITGTELVAVDAMQVYRGMDIGTAKPSTVDRAAHRHHGIDLVEPSATFAVPDFVRAYDQAIVEIAGRGGRALLVAGTGLYLRAVVDRLEPPGQWPEIRARLEHEVADVTSLHARLATLDPTAAQRIEPTNERRVVRALEVCLGSGRPFSSFGPGLAVYPPTDIVQIGLRWSRQALAARVEARVHQMVADGLVDEVRSLAAPGALSHTARQALGYKEILDHLEGRCTLADAIATTIVRTRQFAVRQERWFRRDPRIAWVDVTADPLEALPVVVQALAS